MTTDKCRNCGGDRGIHHYQTDQCPVGGVEAPVGKNQEWKTSTFSPDRTESTRPRVDPADVVDECTKREYFAAMVFHAMTANPELLQVVTASELINGTAAQRVGKVSVEWADALIEALNK